MKHKLSVSLEQASMGYGVHLDDSHPLYACVGYCVNDSWIRRYQQRSHACTLLVMFNHSVMYLCTCRNIYVHVCVYFLCKQPQHCRYEKCQRMSLVYLIECALLAHSCFIK